MFRPSAKILFTAVCVLSSLPAYADLILTAPPRESAEQGEAFYGPIAKYLTEQIGEKVVYRHPDTWEHYGADMRNDKYDIVFDGPHFAAWRMKHLQHTPLVKLPGDLSFVVVTRADRKDIKKLRHMQSKKTCGIASPNLSMLTYLSQFAHASALPPVFEVKGGMPEVYQAFKEGKCDAAVLRDGFYNNKLKAKDKAALKVLYTSNPLPNQTVTVSKRVSKQAQAVITKNLMTTQGAKSAQKLLERFSKKKPNFATASAGQYAGAESLLEGVVWGW